MYIHYTVNTGVSQGNGGKIILEKCKKRAIMSHIIPMRDIVVEHCHAGVVK